MKTFRCLALQSVDVLRCMRTRAKEEMPGLPPGVWNFEFSLTHYVTLHNQAQGESYTLNICRLKAQTQKSFSNRFPCFFVQHTIEKRNKQEQPKRTEKNRIILCYCDKEITRYVRLM